MCSFSSVMLSPRQVAAKVQHQTCAALGYRAEAGCLEILDSQWAPGGLCPLAGPQTKQNMEHRPVSIAH